MIRGQGAKELIFKREESKRKPLAKYSPQTEKSFRNLCQGVLEGVDNNISSRSLNDLAVVVGRLKKVALATAKREPGLKFYDLKTRIVELTHANGEDVQRAILVQLSDGGELRAGSDWRIRASRG